MGEDIVFVRLVFVVAMHFQREVFDSAAAFLKPYKIVPKWLQPFTFIAYHKEGRDTQGNSVWIGVSIWLDLC